MHVELYNTDVYPTKLINCLSVAGVAQWIEHVNTANLFLSFALLVRIPYMTIIIVTIEKTYVFVFLSNYLLFVISFLHFI